MKSLILFTAAILLVGCGVAPVTTMIEGEDTLRGSGKGVAFGPAIFKAENIEGLKCEGDFQASLSSVGTLSCNYGRTGKFIVNGGNGYWIGEGKMSDGKTLRVYINISPESLQN